MRNRPHRERCRIWFGIGDDGNKISMGNPAEDIPSVEQFPNEPSVTTVSHLVIASVSIWGGYGLVAALPLLTGRNLLPSPEQKEDVIRAMVDRDVVDSGGTAPVYGVYGFTLHGGSLDYGGAPPIAAGEWRGGVGPNPSFRESRNRALHGRAFRQFAGSSLPV